MCYDAVIANEMIQNDPYLKSALQSLLYKCTYTEALKLTYDIFIIPTPILYNAYVKELEASPQKKNRPCEDLRAED